MLVKMLENRLKIANIAYPMLKNQTFDCSRMAQFKFDFKRLSRSCGVQKSINNRLTTKISLILAVSVRVWKNVIHFFMLSTFDNLFASMYLSTTLA